MTIHLRSSSTLLEQARIQRAVHLICISIKTEQSPKIHGHGVYDMLLEEKGKN